MPPKKIVLRPGQDLPGTQQKPSVISSAMEERLQQMEREKAEKELAKKNTPKLKIIPSPGGSSASNAVKITPTSLAAADAAATSSASASPSPSSVTTTTTTKSNLEFDNDCDLCNERTNPGELLTMHRPVEHAIFHSWINTVSSEENIQAFIKSNPKSNISKEKTKEIGQLAIEIAKKKDGGPIVWQSAINVWKQIQTAIHHRSLELRIFGSCVAMGTWDGVGDVDLCFVRPPPTRSGQQYDMESASDPKREVHSCARLLRDAGFAFDDLEPVLHARVPIVKHHHSAPEAKDRNGWEAIASRKEARSIVFRFSGAKLPAGVLESLNQIPSARWENSKRDFVYVCESTNEAVAAFVDSYKFIRAAITKTEDALKKEMEDLAVLSSNKDENEQQESNTNKNDDDNHEEEDKRKKAEAVHERRKSSWKQEVEKYQEMKESKDPKNQPRLDEARKHLHDIQHFNRQAFEHSCHKVDWYSNAFFHFPEMFHCDFDLSFRAHGIRNSILLRSYFAQSPLARVGALLVKQWSKETAVNLSMKGYWTTYCVNIVWIAFLIHKKIVKFVDPTTIPVYVTNEQFENEIFRYIPTLGSDDGSILNDAEKIGNLLFEFFYYYGYEFDWSKNVVTLRQDTPFTRDAVSTAKTPWTVDHEVRNGRFRDRVWYRLCVDDPYEENLSLGRHLSSEKADRILTHFRLMAQKLTASNKKTSSSSTTSPLPLIVPLKPDNDELSASNFRKNFVHWFVGHKEMPLKEFIQKFIACDELSHIIFGSANAFLSLSKLLEVCNAVITYGDDEGKEKDYLDCAKITLVNPHQNYISKETYEAVKGIEKELNDQANKKNNNKNDDDDEKKSHDYCHVLVTKEFAKQHKLTGNYIAPLKTFFEFTDMFGGNEFRIFRTREDLFAYLDSKKKSTSSSATHQTGGGASSSSADRRDPSKSWIGTCDDCGAKQRRLYASAVFKNDKSKYCEACWDAYLTA